MDDQEIDAMYALSLYDVKDNTSLTSCFITLFIIAFIALCIMLIVIR